jgi:NADH:ubiquinone oxidoreductase subunit E
MGTVCFLKGANKISEIIQEELQVEPGGTSPDRRFTFQPVNCLGACALAPIMKIDEEYYNKVTPDEIREIFAKYESAPEE